MKNLRLAFLLLTSLSFLLPTFLYSQVDTAWARRFNGPGNSFDEAYAITVDNQGNVYVTGASYGSGTQYDYATIKYNSAGETLWVRRYSIPGIGWDIPQDIAIDNQGNVYIAGFSWGSSTNQYDYATIKYNSEGVEQWVNRYNGIGDDNDWAYDLALDNQGNVYVAGTSDSIQSPSVSNNGYVTIKYNSVGETLWIQRYDGPESEDNAYALAVDEAGNVYVTGESQGPHSPWYDYDYATVKYDSTGETQWVRRYNGPGNRWDATNALAVDDQGNVYVTGKSHADSNYVSGYDYATIKYNAEGVEQWIARYNGTGDDDDEAHAIALDNQGNSYVTGLSSGVFGTGWDMLTIKYNASGDTVWTRRYNGPGDGPDVANSIALDEQGNVYVSGYGYNDDTYKDYLTIKYNSNGEQQWIMWYPGSGGYDDSITSMAIDGNGNVYVTGLNHSSVSDDDYLTIKYVQTGGIEESTTLEASCTMVNPTIIRNVLNIPLVSGVKHSASSVLFDISGRKVLNLQLGANNVSKISPGVYFIKTEDITKQFKILIIR